MQYRNRNLKDNIPTRLKKSITYSLSLHYSINNRYRLEDKDFTYRSQFSKVNKCFQSVDLDLDRLPQRPFLKVCK